MQIGGFLDLSSFVSSPLPRRLPQHLLVTAYIKEVPEDFVVEEVPLYETAGEGEHLFLYVEKRDCAHADMLAIIARALGIREREIGYAGVKDKRAVTRQWVSVPVRCMKEVEKGIEGINVLEIRRHTNKLRTGHLKGNFFSILLRGADRDMAGELSKTANVISRKGFYNFFGPQRFGPDGRTVSMGLSMLKGRCASMSAFVKRMAISALQAAIFNFYLCRRIELGYADRVIRGDVMQKVTTHGLFHAEDVEVEQARLERGETSITGPIYGHKLFEAIEDAGVMEKSVLLDAGLEKEHFRLFAKLAEGTRRPIIVRPEGLTVSTHESGLVLSFFLPKGSYASILLLEFVEGLGRLD